jgi:anti-sigma factor RsiW
MRGCLDEGILQSYFDGELSNDHMESVTSHLVSCTRCASAARELEGEVLLLSSALAPEFDAIVPTERLRHRIDAAVAEQRVGSQNIVPRSLVDAGRGWLQSFTTLFAFTPQRTFGYAALAVVLAFGTIIGVIQMRQVQSPTISNQDSVAITPSNAPTAQPDTRANIASPVASPSLVASTPIKRPRRERPRATVNNPDLAEVKLLPGERSYLKTIAALDSTINANSNRPMRPSLQAEYERNLAVVDRALAATRNAAKKNPNDPDAVEFMFNAYQSKVDLLNTVADARLYNRP